MFGVLKLGKLGASMRRFNPRTLFAASEPGAWYDTSDMSTLFQDSAGTVPVTAVEQPVGRILDKSGRGNHATQATTTKRPVLSRRVNAFSTTQAVFNGTVTVITDAFGPGFDGLQLTRTYASDDVFIAINPSDVRGGSTYTLKVLLKKGGHPSTYQVVSFYTTAGYVTVSVNWATGNITSGAMTGGFTITNQSSVQLSADSYYVTLGYAVPAGVTSVTLARVYFWTGALDTPSSIIGNPQFTLATDAHLPYQWVNTATDYDADPAKFPAYLRFDGVDDALQTGNIDFTSTDKMTVWAGVTRLTSSGVGLIAELSTNSTITNGSWRIADFRADGNFGSSQSFGSRGTILAGVDAAAIGGPANTVITGAADIGAGTIAASGFLDAPVAANQGTGNYGNHPLYVGARGGAGQYFNGRIYSLIVRGTQTPLSQIEATELYTKQKMRLP